MSYQVLARQFRPQNFKELIGQEHVSQALINGLEQNRLHHAFLFTGTRGVGKTTVARILAKSLNCETGVTGHPCGECSSCIEITEGRFIDLVEVDAASRTGVDDTRELLDNVQYAPSKGRYKIYLIDEVHMFSNSSFNALLKTLEEPPPHVKFLLATTEPKKLPVTVLSRCLQFNLKRLNLSQIQDHLARLLEIQEIEYDDAALELIARAADGSMRDGLSLLDQALAYGAGTVKDQDVRLMLGTLDQKQVHSLLLSLLSKDSKELSSQLNQIFEMAPDYSRFLQDLAVLLHEVSLYQILNSYVESSQFDKQSITDLADKMSAELVQLYYQIVIKGQSELGIAPDRKIGFEMTIIRLFAFELAEPSLPSHPNKRQEPSQQRHDGGLPVTPNQKSSISSSQPNQTGLSESLENNQNTPASQPIEPSQYYSIDEIVQSQWDSIFLELKLKGTARELARNASVIENTGSQINFAIDKQAHVFMTEKAQQRFKQAIQRVTQSQVEVNLCNQTPVNETIAKKQQKIESHHKQQTQQKVDQSRFVQQIQKNFDAEVIEVKNKKII